MNSLKRISLAQIKRAVSKIKPSDFKEADLVVGIGSSGLEFASLLAKRLKKPLEEIKLKRYSDGMPPKKIFEEPRLVKPLCFDAAGKNVLLADDICRTGETLDKARRILLESGAKSVSFCCLAGEKDFCLLKEGGCAAFPWTKTSTARKTRLIAPH